MESHKNLVDQCVQGEGLVQVNVQIRTTQRCINIVDVLKPAEDYVEYEENNCMYYTFNLFYLKFNNDHVILSMKCFSSNIVVMPLTEGNKQNIIRWTVDAQYKREQVNCFREISI